jgi:hypothetical protein
MSSDNVDHPTHYNSHPSGVEAITITEHFPFNVGNAIKYLWRAGLKGDSRQQIEDLRKAAWYCNREIQRITDAGRSGTSPND